MPARLTTYCFAGAARLQEWLPCLLSQSRVILALRSILNMLPWARMCFLALVFCFALACCSADKVNYAEVRTRVSHAFEEKTHEMLETLASLQELSRETSALLANIDAHCGSQG